MQIISGFPPNISTIRQYLTPPPDAVFAYGDFIFNPTNKDIPPDVYEHELVHGRQMQGWQPDAWWLKYCLDREFRQNQEVAAFSAQYQWVKDRVSARVAKLCLFDLASNMFSLYNLGISISQAETLIRKYKN